MPGTHVVFYRTLEERPKKSEPVLAILLVKRTLDAPGAPATGVSLEVRSTPTTARRQ